MSDISHFWDDDARPPSQVPQPAVTPPKSGWCTYCGEDIPQRRGGNRKYCSDKPCLDDAIEDAKARFRNGELAAGKELRQMQFTRSARKQRGIA